MPCNIGKFVGNVFFKSKSTLGMNGFPGISNKTIELEEGMNTRKIHVRALERNGTLRR
jgi:hypothetical protein